MATSIKASPSGRHQGEAMTCKWPLHLPDGINLARTRILASKFIAAGPSSRVLEEVIDTRLELVLPQPVLVELKRILTGKLGFKPQRRRGVEGLSFTMPGLSEMVKV